MFYSFDHFRLHSYGLLALKIPKFLMFDMLILLQGVIEEVLLLFVCVQAIQCIPVSVTSCFKSF